MSFPNFSEKYHGEGVVRPQDVLAMHKCSRKFPNVPAPGGIIMCLKNDLPRQLRWRIPIRKVGKVMGDFYLVKSTRGRVGVLSNFGIGAPVLASLTEEMIAWGVKRFVILSWGGALQASLNTADIVLADKAIRDEGVSQHYLPPEMYAHSNASLTENLKKYLPVNFSTGATWTIDAPYRETHEEIIKYRSEGVQVVEMEIASLFAVAQVRGVEAAAMVVVADKLANLEWEMPKDMLAVERSFEIIYRAAILALNEDA